MANVLTKSITVNNQQLTWTYTYNGFSQVLTATDPMGFVTTNTYDSHGNLLTTTTPSPDGGTTAGSTTTFTYDNKGQLLTITDPRNNTTTLTYTAAGLVQTVTDAQNQVTTYEYDARGNRTAVVDALNHRTAFEYDSMNRLKKITYPDLTTTQFAYDTRGRRTSVTDANGKVTTYAYDDADRLTSVTDAQSPTHGVTSYAYDTESSLTSITDALNRTTSFTYDGYGRVTRTTFPSTLFESYTYDTVGNLLSKTDRKNQAITYAYDGLDRLSSKTYPDSSAVNYTYDNDSRLTQVTDATGTYSFTFDNMGRLTGTSTQYSFLLGRTFTNSYGYDAASNRTSATLDGNTVAYIYDSLNRLTDLSSAWAGQFTYSYDALSRRTGLTRPNAVNTTYNYDSLSRLLSILHQAGATTVDGAAYGYDSAGNRTSKTNYLNSTSEQYAYDGIYQLLQVTSGGNTTESYTYDLVGNRLSSLGVPSYSYNSSNQLTSTSAATFTYDNNGNTLTKADSSGTTTYAWDFENRLTSVTLPNNGGVVSFQYDPFGRRIQKSGPGGTTNYVYDGANAIEEYNGAGALVAKYAHSTGIDEPLAMSRAGTVSYYEADGLGSVTSLTDNAGAAEATYVTDAFGSSASSSGTLINPFRYTAREFDSESGLYYYRARYFDPSTGRFLQEDPIGFGEGPNFYRYARNNPTNATDPLGLATAPVTAPAPAPQPVILNIEALSTVALAGADLILAVELIQTIQAINSENQTYAQQMQAEGKLNQALAQNSGPYPSNLLNYHSNQAKKKCANNGCKPCIPPVGTIAYRLDKTGPPHNGVPTPHWKLYVMQQNPSNCQCQWVDIPDNQGGFGEGSTPPTGTTPIQPSSGGGRP